MLTANLVRARIRSGTVKPQYIDPASPVLKTLAEELIALFQLHIDRPYGELQEAMKAVVGVGVDALLGKGLCKLLEDRCTFEVGTQLEPKEVRRRLFETATPHHPVALEADERRTGREAILKEVAEEMEVTPEEIEAAMYADLPAARLVRCEELPSADWLLHRYNAALAQAVLLRATRVTILLEGNSPARYRQLFRFIKFFRLMHRLEQRDGGGYRIELDGPLSLFKLSQKYGLQLAEMVPALLLCEGWRLEAEVQWGQQRKEQSFKLSPKEGLRSHYPDKGAYETREEKWFKERFQQLDSEWTVDSATEILELGGQGIVIPDLTLRHADGRVAYLEIIGFWKRDYLERRLALYREYGPGNLILAVAKQLQGSLDGLKGFEGEISTFREVIMAKEILAFAEKVGKVPA